MIYKICTHPWEFWVEPFRIAGNVYYVGNSDVSSHLIDTGEGLILIDTTYPQTVYLLLEAIRRLGFDPDQIRYILHCHAHYDHCGGTRAIIGLTGAKTAMGKDDIEILEKKPELTWAPEYGTDFYETFDVDLPLVDGQMISLGNTSVMCVHTPGHTPGATSFIFQTEDCGNEYTVGMHGGPGINTLTEDFLSKHNLPLSNRDDYMRSVERLRAYEVDIFIGAHPGQNGTLGKRALMKEGVNPFIDRTAWTAFLDKLDRRAKQNFGVA